MMLACANSAHKIINKSSGSNVDTIYHSHTELETKQLSLTNELVMIRCDKTYPTNLLTLNWTS